jgi:hypothetical protein
MIFPMPSRSSREYDGKTYTDEEVDKFPLEIRCCFHLQPWNRKYMPKSIDDWAEIIGFILFLTSPGSRETIPIPKAVEIAASEARRLHGFLVREYLLLAQKLGNMEETNEGLNKQNLPE